MGRGSPVVDIAMLVLLVLLHPLASFSPIFWDLLHLANTVLLDLWTASSGIMSKFSDVPYLGESNFADNVQLIFSPVRSSLPPFTTSATSCISGLSDRY